MFFFGFFWVFFRGIKDGKKSILRVNYPLKEPVFYHIHTASEGAVLMASIWESLRFRIGIERAEAGGGQLAAGAGSSGALVRHLKQARSRSTNWLNESISRRADSDNLIKCATSDTTRNSVGTPAATPTVVGPNEPEAASTAGPASHPRAMSYIVRLWKNDIANKSDSIAGEWT